MSKIYVDCGAHQGDIFRLYYGQFDEYHLFEIHPVIHKKLIESLPKDGKVYVHNNAVWTENGTAEFYLSQHDTYGSTMIKEKQSGRIDVNNPHIVDTVDFSNFILSLDATYLHVKMDIEGAEYAVLDKMIKDDTLRFVDTLEVEFHSHKIQSSHIKKQHDSLLNHLTKLENLTLITHS
jgi:FkbM family methyltransferase